MNLGIAVKIGPLYSQKRQVLDGRVWVGRILRPFSGLARIQSGQFAFKFVHVCAEALHAIILRRVGLLQRFQLRPVGNQLALKP